MLGFTLPLHLLVGSPPGPSLEWHAPPGCPSGGSLRRRIRTALADVPPGPALSVRGEVTRVDDINLRLDMTVSDGGTTGSTQTPVFSGRCDELAEYLVHHVEVLWRSQASPAPPRKGPRPRLRAAGNTALPAEEGRWFLGGQLVAALQWPRGRIELGLSGDHAMPHFGVVNYRLDRAQLLVRGCGDVSSGPVELHLCAGVEGGVVVYRILTGSAPPTVGPTLNLQLGPALTWWFHRHVGLWLGMTALGRLIPPAIRENYTEVKVCKECPDDPRARFSFAGNLGLEFRWGR